MELSRDTLGIPVISIGVPTVVDAMTLARDLIEEATGDKMHRELRRTWADLRRGQYCDTEEYRYGH